jgi:transcriptional regulator with XRE-family HTH domain
MLQLGAPHPVGIGTPECESLSSYVQRLAIANGTFPGQLVHRLLAWVQQGDIQEIGAWNEHPRGVYLGRNINAFGLATTWLGLLAKVVPHQPLIHLTANQWAQAFPSRGFLHPTLCWCPICLAQDREPYHRLLWMLQPVTHCILHGVTLAGRCPRCRRFAPIIHDRSHIEICPWCAWDLRDTDATPHRTDDDAPNDLGQIIAHFGSSSDFTKWSSQTGIRALCRFAKLTNSAQLARATGISKLTAWYWWTGRARISLPMALHVYSRLGASFSTAVIHEATHATQRVTSDTQTRLHLRGRQPPKPIDWRFTAKRIAEILQRPLVTAPTFLAAAAELGIERRTLRAHFPKLCRMLAKRHHQRLRRERAERARNLMRDFRRAIGVLVAAGLEPRQYRIEEVLKRPGLFNRRYARDVLVETLS